MDMPHANTMRLWTYKTCLTQLILVVDDFGVKYVGKEHLLHLISDIKEFILNIQLIVKANYSTALHYNGTILNCLSIYQCQDTSKISYTNFNIEPQNSNHMHCIHTSGLFMVKTHRCQHLLTKHHY